MAPLLGKRKRTAPKEPAKATDGGSEREKTPTEDEARILADVFRRHFEQRFRPLEKKEEKVSQSELNQSDGESEHDSENEWSGFTEDEVEVIEHNGPTKSTDEFSDRAELKAFMVRSNT